MMLPSSKLLLGAVTEAAALIRAAQVRLCCVATFVPKLREPMPCPPFFFGVVAPHRRAPFKGLKANATQIK